MLAKDIMSKKPTFLSPSATIKEAANEMLNHDFGFIPVGENDRLIGAVTDRDIVVKAVAEGKDPNKTTLKDVMSEGIQFCFETDDLEKITNKMEKLQIRRLVVLDKDKRMTGIISLGDIVTKSKDARISSELTEAVSKD